MKQIKSDKSEAWVYQNKEVFNAIKSGLDDAKSGKINDSPEDYSKYLASRDKRMSKKP